MKLKEKEQAIKLRKQGLSLREISFKLKVSKSTASLWIRDIPLSRKAQKILDDKFTKGQLAAQKAKRAETERRLLIAHEIGVSTVKLAKMNANARKILCAMIYWCEGRKSKSDRDLAFTNSDPQLVILFLKLLRNSFDLEEKKFSVCVHLHSYHDREKQLQFWSETTNIPLQRFIKPYLKSNTGKQNHEGYPGCASVRYSDVVVARELIAIARVFLNGSIV